MKIYTKISIGLLAGVIFGLILGPKAVWIEPVGKAFIRLITMVVVPLVFASLAVGTASLGSIKRLGRIGVKTIAYYMFTTAIAVTIGLSLANVIRPGSGLEETTKTRLLQDYQESSKDQVTKAVANKPKVTDVLLQIIPTNPIRAMADGDMLGLIFFALALGISLTYLPSSRSQPVISFLDGLNEAIIQLVHLIMKVAPYGVFALIAAVTGRFGYAILLTLIKYSLVVLLGLLIHAGGVYSLLIRILGRMNPVKFFRGLRDAQLVAFSTSSSNATLPVNMECCQENLGVPGAGIITLTLVLQTIGIPLEGIALILGVDRILDMCRTVVNITGDASCSVFISRTEKKYKSVIADSQELAELETAPE